MNILERLRQTAVRVTKPKVDVVANIRQLVEGTKSVNEIPKDKWFDALSQVDRSHVISFIEYIREHERDLPGIRIAVIAVGSSVVPPGEQASGRQPEDIDLRILNSTWEGSTLRDWVITSLREMSGQFFGERDKHYVKTVAYHYWGESDISILETPKESIVLQKNPRTPLHILISGHKQPDMSTHLFNEGKDNGNFVVLHKS